MREFNFKGEMFIVPNKIDYPEGWLSSSEKARMAAIAETQGVTFIDGMKWVQIWLVIPGMSKNATDHGINVDDDTRIDLNMSSGLVPADRLKHTEEGDYAYLKFRGRISGTKEECLVTVAAKANQTSYRYSQFGRFEEVYAKVA